MSRKMYKFEATTDHVAVRLQRELDDLKALYKQFESDDRTHTLSKKHRLEKLPKIREDIEAKRAELAQHLATKSTSTPKGA